MGQAATIGRAVVRGALIGLAPIRAVKPDGRGLSAAGSFKRCTRASVHRAYGRFGRSLDSAGAAAHDGRRW